MQLSLDRGCPSRSASARNGPWKFSQAILASMPLRVEHPRSAKKAARIAPRGFIAF